MTRPSKRDSDIDIETRLYVCLSVRPLGAGIVQMTETLDVSLGTVVFQTPKILVKFHWGHPQHRVGYNWDVQLQGPSEVRYAIYRPVSLPFPLTLSDPSYSILLI